MKRKIILILITLIPGLVLMVSCVAVEIARAQEPTGTWEPIWSTPVPEGTDDFTCPEGTPVGYGEVTPDIWWSINCANCAAGLTQTVGTATPAVSPTPVIGANFELQCDYYKIESTQISCQEQRGRSISLTLNGTMPSGYLGLVVRFICKEGYTCPDVNGLMYDEFSFTGSEHYPPGYTLEWTGFITRGYPYDTQLGKDCGNTTVCDYEFSGGIEFPKSFSDGQVAYTFWIQGHAGVSSIEDQLNVTVSLDPIGEPTPEPTPQSGYCASVDPGTGGGMGDLPGLPIIRRGAATCGGIPEIDLDMSSWPIIGEIIPEIYFPGFQVCFIPITIDNLQIFNLTVDLNVILTVMAGVIAFRIFTRIIA